MKYKLSRLAEKDIEDILSYTIETWGLNQFRNYQKQIEDSLDIISSDPYHPISRNRKDLLNECRSYAFGKHIIFYRVKNDIVEIIRILHQKMDFETHISDV